MKQKSLRTLKDFEEKHIEISKYMNELLNKRFPECQVEFKYKPTERYLSPDELKGKGIFQTPIGDDNMKNFIDFVLHHEAYHIGQIGFIRKQLGKESMKYD